MKYSCYNLTGICQTFVYVVKGATFISHKGTSIDDIIISRVLVSVGAVGAAAPIDFE